MPANPNRSLPPVHPGVFIREDVLPYIEPDQTGLAGALGIDPQRLEAIVQEKEDIDTDVALRLGKAPGNGARFWIALQIDYDIWNAEQSFQGTVLLLKQPSKDHSSPCLEFNRSITSLANSL